jgi:hypothetical protein
MPALLNSAMEHTQAAGMWQTPSLLNRKRQIHHLFYNYYITYRTAGGASGADLMYVRNLFQFIFPTFVEAIEQEMESEVLDVMLASFIKVKEQQTRR